MVKFDILVQRILFQSKEKEDLRGEHIRQKHTAKTEMVDARMVGSHIIINNLVYQTGQ